MVSFDRSRLDALPDEYVTAIEHFEDMKSRCADTTLGTYLNRVTNFCEFLQRYYDEYVPLEAVSEKEHVYPFRDHLDETKSKTNMRSTIITCADWYRVLARSDEFDVDPSAWGNVEDNLPSSNEVRSRTQSSDDVSVSEVGSALLNISHPLYHALFLMFFKLLLRSGEAVNIELQHVHLQDPDFYRIYEDLGVEIHEKIRNKPDTIYIDPSKDGTKRTEETILPVDAEVKAALLRALAIRPTTPASLSKSTFFASHSQNYGLDLSPSSVSNAFDEYLVEPNDEIPASMSPHDGRHWGTRKLRATKNDNEVLLMYLRGDANDSIIDQYDNLLADYERRVRRRYERQMPSLFF